MRRAKILSVAVLLSLGSCAPPADLGVSRAVQELSGREAGAERQCVPVNAGENLRVIDDHTLAVGHGRTIFVNHLRDSCSGVAGATTLVSEIHGGEYCRGDQVRGLEPFDIAPGPSCILSNWTPYTRR